MLAGSVVVSRVESAVATWITLISLLVLHLMLNYKAVSAVKMRTLNRQRANLVFGHLLAADKTLDQKQVAKRERIFERDGVLGYARIGISIAQLQATQQRLLRARDGKSPSLAWFFEAFEKEDYILVISAREKTYCRVDILLRQKCGPRTQLKAWFHALVLAREVKDGSDMEERDLVRTSLKKVEATFEEYVTRLERIGWEMDDCMVETHCGPRISM
jgi:hypothetical protein